MVLDQTSEKSDGYESANEEVASNEVLTCSITGHRWRGIEGVIIACKWMVREMVAVRQQKRSCQQQGTYFGHTGGIVGMAEAIDVCEGTDKPLHNKELGRRALFNVMPDRSLNVVPHKYLSAG